ncbi:SDR family NAD(P)-dependent oxidoreductase [Pleomorphomonas sp. JP5]|uniref:SDR family NAD(P)-dependent oxidoreductase n=1 Tax=Pleomorphomonas sp. JP5 TaxID=2942998 RepID=UPI002043AA58|nr:SDR family NAD(P)-dependent oxidoreductase [Pleomorphomonas sp. JP5]MCM5557211.1 SDR family NAD(P)-dependent oxidoreductase [Pleomorphomonas sp. JP5]
MTPTVLITGASRGVGLELVRQYLQRGARVLAIHRPGPVPEALASLYADHADHMRLISLDVRAASAVVNLAARLSERIDILINNTGMLLGTGVSPSGNLVGGTFRASLQVNATGPLFVAQAALSNMTRGGKIATILPIGDVRSLDLLDADARQAAKAAVVKVMQSLAHDLKPAGVSVALIHPGAVGTGPDGEEAQVSLAESARGIVGVIDALTLETTGQFFGFDGGSAED